MGGVGAGPDTTHGLVIDIDATITLAHSDKKNAAKTWKRTFGPTHCWPTSTGPTLLAGNPGRDPAAGSAGSNTADDHVTILTMALSALPGHA